MILLWSIIEMKKLLHMNNDHEYLKKVTIGILKKHNATIYLSEYDPN